MPRIVITKNTVISYVIDHNGKEVVMFKDTISSPLHSEKYVEEVSKYVRKACAYIY